MTNFTKARLHRAIGAAQDAGLTVYGVDVERGLVLTAPIEGLAAPKVAPPDKVASPDTAPPKLVALAPPKRRRGKSKE